MTSDPAQILEAQDYRRKIDESQIPLINLMSMFGAPSTYMASKLLISPPAISRHITVRPPLVYWERLMQMLDTHAEALKPFVRDYLQMLVAGTTVPNNLTPDQFDTALTEYMLLNNSDSIYTMMDFYQSVYAKTAKAERNRLEIRALFYDPTQPQTQETPHLSYLAA